MEKAEKTTRNKREKGVILVDPKTGKKKRVSRTWAAAQRLKGSLIVYDPKFLE